MQRRGFIKVLAAGGVVALSPVVLNSCASGSGPVPKSIEKGQQDMRLQLLSFAMLAPNSHNIQPWLVRLKGEDSFDLFVDRERLLPKTDPPARQIHISQGTFLETLRIAASKFGYGVQIDYFPLGEYSNMVIEDKPVATVRLYADQAVRPDPLFELLTVRQSNKRNYENREMPESDLVVIREQYPRDGIEVFADGSKSFRKRLSPILGKSMGIETIDRDRNIETADLFRFSEEEALLYRDGFTMANNGMTGLVRYITEKFFLGTREEAYAVGSAFAKEGVKLTYRQAESAAAYGWIVSNSNTRLDQLKTGHIYARINLQTAKMGIAQHPMSQVLQEYDDMRDLQQEFLDFLQIPEGRTVQMLYRLGYAEANPHTYRRRVKQMLRS